MRFGGQSGDEVICVREQCQKSKKDGTGWDVIRYDTIRYVRLVWEGEHLMCQSCGGPRKKGVRRQVEVQE